MVALRPSGSLGLQSSEAPSSGILKRQLCGRERKREEQAREGGKGRGARSPEEGGGGESRESRESGEIAFKL